MSSLVEFRTRSILCRTRKTVTTFQDTIPQPSILSFRLFYRFRSERLNRLGGICVNPASRVLVVIALNRSCKLYSW